MGFISSTWRAAKKRCSSLIAPYKQKAISFAKKGERVRKKVFKTCHIALCDFLVLFSSVTLTKAYLVLTYFWIDDRTIDQITKPETASPVGKFSSNIGTNFFIMPIFSSIGSLIFSGLVAYFPSFLRVPSENSHTSSFLSTLTTDAAQSESFWARLITAGSWIYYGIGKLYSGTIGALSNQFTLPENMSTWQHVSTLGEIIAADCLHMMPLLVIVFHMALALPELPFLMIGTLGFCAAYRTLFLMNIILSGVELQEPSHLPEEGATVTNAFDPTPAKFEQQEANEKIVFLGKLYNWSIWKRVSDTSLDPYSSVIYIPLENYFYIAHLYKGIHLLITAPFVVADFLALSAQNSGKAQSTFTGAFKRTGYAAYDFAVRFDNTFIPSSYSLFASKHAHDLQAHAGRSFRRSA